MSREQFPTTKYAYTPTPTPTCTVWRDGTKEWRLNGQRHRTDGPAVEYASGTKEWWLNGQRHRTDGPAVEYASGTEWWLNGQRHREGGPATEWADGIKEWWLNGQRHRTDGPAVEWTDGTKEWWLNGQEFDEGDNLATATRLAESLPYTLWRVQTPEGTRYVAGCRRFTLAKARSHWRVGGSERQSFIDALAQEN